MIEAPEALCLAGQLNATVKGRRIVCVDAGHTPHKFTFYNGNPADYPRWLENKAIGECHARGGMVEITAEDFNLVLSDGVNLKYIEPGGKLPGKYQMLIGLDDDSCLVASVRMYGGLWCFRPEDFTSQISAYYKTARNKPQVMSPDFTPEYFAGLIRDETVQNKSVKAFLATDQTIPGLGNGVLQDILYEARIHPKKKVSALPERERVNLYNHLRRVLDRMYCCGGRSSEADLFGRSGGYVPFLSKDTAGRACVRCGETITKESYLGGSVYYCPGCQPL